MGRYEATLVRAGETLPTDRRSDLGAVLGFEPGARTTESTPIPPEPDTVLESLVPDPGKGTVLLVRCTSSLPEQLPEATRIFLRRASLESSLQPNSTWGPGVVWEQILRQGVRHLRAHGAALTAFDDAGLPRAQWTYTPDSLSAPAGPEVTDLPRRLWELHNGGPSSTKRLQAIHEVFTQLAPDWEFAVAGSLESSLDPIEPIPLHLAVEADTNGSSGFAGPYPRVQVVPARPATDHLRVNTTLQVRLSARRNDGNWEPLAGVGTGVSQALVLAETIGDAAGRFAFLDEPAANLHPSWQRHMRARLEAISDPDTTGGPGQFVMVTHSEALAAPVHQSKSTLPIRLAHDGKASTLMHPPHGELPSDWPRDLQLSPDGWGLLFADAVVLVEGETELGALPRWFDKITEAADTLAWSARNIAMFSVGGHYGFESWGRYLSHYHVPWAVVCDGSIIDPYRPTSPARNTGDKVQTAPISWSTTRHWVLLQVARARSDDVLCAEAKKLCVKSDSVSTRPDSPTFRDATTLGETYGIFTLANWFAKQGELPQPPEGISPVESIDELIARNNGLRVVADCSRKELGSKGNKVRLGLYVADACDPPCQVKTLYDKVTEWLADSGAKHV
ncbi:MAG: ATP-dependent nuclease [Deltaproteobacteria bacterium]